MDSNRPLSPLAAPAKGAVPVSTMEIDAPPIQGEGPAAEPPLVADKRLRLVVFLMLLTAMFMATLDNQIVSTALPTIVAEFGQLERFGWVGSAYLLATSAVMPLYGKLGDLFGRKYVMIAAVAIFTLGSLVCGLAVSMNTLIAARVLQALGGGGIMVSIFSINADLFEPRERAKYQSYSALVIMASGAAGPILGGTMSDFFGWRSIFLVNLPIGLLVLTGLIFLLPYRKPKRKPKIDYAGALLLAGAAASIVFWADSSILFGSLVAPESLGVLAFGLACLVGWVLVERRVEEPVVPLSLFASPTICRLLLISLLTGGIGIGMVNYMALFLQTTTGLTPTLAGLMFVSTAGGMSIGSILAGRVISRTGRYKIFSIIGSSIGVGAFLVFAFFVHPTTPIPLLVLIMLAQGFGIGFGQQVPVLGVQNAADPRDVGAATGTVTLARMGGAAIAISMYGAIVASSVGHLPAPIAGVKNIEELTPKMLAALPPETQHAIATTYADAFGPLFLTAAGICFITLLTALSLKNILLPVEGDSKKA